MQFPSESIYHDYNIIYFPEIGSTNEYASEIVSKCNPNDKIAIVAGFQSKGKGQYDRKWCGEPEKNIMMSVIMSPPKIRATEVFYLNMIVSVAVLNLFKKFCDINVSIKWPNDIYHEERKLGGILIKNKIIGPDIQNTVIGIGLNVNQSIFDASLDNPISVIQIIEKEMNLKYMIKALLDELNIHFDNYSDNGIGPICREYNKNLFGRDEKRTFIVNGVSKILCIKNVDSDGTIHLEDKFKNHFSMTSGLEYVMR
jgi:BirA family biotin operon repressor/biotin-[acetyl-CoA-carboxylase] ligase